MKLHKVNNKSCTDENAITCQSDCLLFDEVTGKCGYYNNEVPNDPFYTSNCELYVDRNEWEEFNDEISREDTYPLQPAKEIERNDAVWYVSPDKQFGCWIVALSKEYRLMSADRLALVQDEIRRGKYRSPYPLHDHGVKGEVASEVAWVIDKDGIGQYAWINGNTFIYMN